MEFLTIYFFLLAWCYTDNVTLYLIMTTTKEKNEIMYKNIIEHGKNLKRVFNLDSSIDVLGEVNLSQYLRMLIRRDLKQWN